MRAMGVCVASVSCVAMSGCGDFRDCAEVDVSQNVGLPERLSETVLYEDIVNDVVSDDAFAFTPVFPLWTDGATKRRWLVLPAGESIDTSSVDNWVFPVGTRLFKEFTRDGVRVETRILQRTEQGWAAAAYIWEGDDAFLAPEGAVDAVGTQHDVPEAGACMACHGGRESVVLGLSTVQADDALRTALVDSGRISQAIAGDLAIDDASRAGLGVLHANCSHCHNPERDSLALATPCYRPGTNFDLTLPSSIASVDEAPAVATASRVLGRPDRSVVLTLMGERNDSLISPSMPPVGTEEVDDAGMDLIRAFLVQLEE